MAKDKKSVLLYCDLIHTVEKMDNETAGLFFKHYLRYVNDLNPETDNLIVDLTFESVKQNLKRDLKKWEERAEKSRVNGSLGGRPRKKPKKPTGLLENQIGLKKPDTVTVTVNGTVNVIDIKEKQYSEFWDLYNKKVENKKCKAKFLKLSSKEIEKIFITLPKYIKSTPDVKFRKNPLTYLNGECWNDEIDTKPNQEPKDDNYIYYKWQTDVTGIRRKVLKSEAEELFKSQLVGGYKPTIL